CLCIRIMQFGQMSTVVFHAFDRADNERVDTLCVILEILLHSDNVSVLVLLHNIHLGLNHTDVVKVCASLSCIPGKCQCHCSALRSCKEDVHILEVAGAVHCRAGVAVCVSFDIVLCDRLFRIVGI